MNRLVDPGEPMEMIYGLHPVREVLLTAVTGGRQKTREMRIPPLQRAGGIEKIYLARSGQAAEDIFDLARQLQIPVIRVSPVALTRLAGTQKHQGVAAVRSEQITEGIDALLARCQSPPAFLFVLDGIEDPRNLGAIIRTADAVGATGVIIPERRAAGLTGMVAKAAAGATAHLPITRVVNISAAIDRIKAANIWTVGLDAAAKMSYLDYDFRAPVAIVLGAEGGGLHQKVKAHCDGLISLPMRGHVASLNVSVAAAVVAYEVLRQRGISHPFQSMRS